MGVSGVPLLFGVDIRNEISYLRANVLICP